MNPVVGYVYSMLHVDYSFQVDGSQLMLIVGCEDHGNLFQVSALAGTAWLLESWYRTCQHVGLPELLYASSTNLLYEG